MTDYLWGEGLENTCVCVSLWDREFQWVLSKALHMQTCRSLQDNSSNNNDLKHTNHSLKEYFAYKEIVVFEWQNKLHLI